MKPRVIVFKKQIVLVFTPPGQYEQRHSSDSLRGLHIHHRIADHVRAREINAPLVRGIAKHFRARLATITALVGLVRAEIDRVYAPARALDFTQHAYMNIAQLFFCERATIYAGLIGRHDSQKATRGDPAETVQSTGQKTKFVPGFDMVGAILIDDPIAVEENSATKRCF